MEHGRFVPATARLLLALCESGALAPVPARGFLYRDRTDFYRDRQDRYRDTPDLYRDKLDLYWDRPDIYMDRPYVGWDGGSLFKGLHCASG